MGSFAEFLHMGGYAFFVWTSYALTAVCLIGVVVWSSVQYRKTRQQTFKRALQHQAKRAK
ncbi:heme exporter protein CcmD [Granulosicoccus sp.]|nr:heme exporter protein CcmD [Granulosicoccus sp.]